jgi:hypothetical protein
VPEDVNGGADVYEWHAGTVSLITDGVTPRLESTPPELLSVSPDGRDVLFIDPTRLTTDARDGAWKLYDARAGGGFEPAPPPPSPCVGDGCRGPLPGAPTLLGPGTGSGGSGGNVVPPPEAHFGVHALTHAQRTKLARTGRAVLSVRVSGAGRLSLVAQATIGGRVRTVARARATAHHAATVALALRLSKTARHQLAAAGRLRLILVVRLANSSSPPKRLAVELRS